MQWPAELEIIGVLSHKKRLVWICPICGQNEVTTRCSSSFQDGADVLNLPSDWRCSGCRLSPNQPIDRNSILFRDFSTMLKGGDVRECNEVHQNES